MSPRHDKEKKQIHNSTTEFFLKVVQKEKEQPHKESATKDNINYTKTKTIDSVGRFYNYINQLLDKILSSKASIMVLSFMMAGILFYSISLKDMITSPTSGTTLENVPVEIENLNPALELTGVPDNVAVGLIGPSLDIYKTNFTKDYVVYLDLGEYEEGEYTVNLKTRNFPETLKVIPIPSSLKIKLSPKIDASFDLGYRFINEDKLDSKYSVSVDEMELNSVKLRASHETLQKVAKVEACIDVSDKTEAFEQDAKIKAYDGSGKELKIEISPTTVHVKCQVSSYSKEVALKARFVGDLPAGYEIAKYTLSQESVTIYGLEEKIKDIQEVYADVDVNELKATTTISNLALKKEPGVNKFSSANVDITIEVEKVITKKFEKIPIKVLNNTENYKVSFAGEGGYATVSVSGTEAKIAALTADNIQVSVDVDGQRVGTRRVDVKAAVDDEKLKIELLSSSKVTINIERK